MVFGIDFAIIDPVRPVESERRGHQSPAKNLGAVQPVGEEIQNLLEANLAARRGGRIIDAQSGDMHVLIALLHMQEQVIDS
jgi:hypothetical protein